MLFFSFFYDDKFFANDYRVNFVIFVAEYSRRSAVDLSKCLELFFETIARNSYAKLHKSRRTRMIH